MWPRLGSRRRCLYIILHRLGSMGAGRTQGRGPRRPSKVRGPLVEEGMAALSFKDDRLCLASLLSSWVDYLVLLPTQCQHLKSAQGRFFFFFCCGSLSCHCSSKSILFAIYFGVFFFLQYLFGPFCVIKAADRLPVPKSVTYMFWERWTF